MDDAQNNRWANDLLVQGRGSGRVLGVPLEFPAGWRGFWYLKQPHAGDLYSCETRNSSSPGGSSGDFDQNARLYREMGELNRTLERRVVQRTRRTPKKIGSWSAASSTQPGCSGPSFLQISFELHLADYFVLWKPRDLVGGDFYWFQETSWGFLLAVADCTGHGVPGAFMTMAAHTNLNRVAVEAKPDNLAQSLVQLHRLTKETLGQRRDRSESDDGLDIGLCAYERSSDILTYAGARIDLLAVGRRRKGRSRLSGQFGLRGRSRFPCSEPHFCSSSLPVSLLY